MRMVGLPSKALAEAGYDPATRTLRVRFRHGGLYDYHGVPSQVWDDLLASAHPWTEWGDHIKQTYPFERLD